ncbi:MAG: gluconolaconase [Acidocella sp. 20-63-7]|nr:MAG: gluconolaconase [Acidocella sp. 20-63-7]HQT46102.1 SMP-30/gluconolactonase/LRE family protein [Acidocella sp.]
MTTDLVFTRLGETSCELAESPVWDAVNGALLWVDIPQGVIHQRHLATGAQQSWRLGDVIGSIGLARSGRLVVARQHEVGFFDRHTGAYEKLASVGPADAGLRLNDGKVGPDGAFWVGSMDLSGQSRPVGTLYRVQADGTVEAKCAGLITSNGLAWSADGETLFHSDSRGCWIDRWNFDASSGAISARTRIATPGMGDGRPDGGATDAAGTYWSAGVSAGCLNRYARDGRVLARLALPVAAPTMPCFGGEDLRTLFVTSLRKGPQDGPLEGAILTARVECPGVPVAVFADYVASAM